MRAVFDAIQAFFEHLAAVDFKPLGLAVVVHLLKMCCTSMAWRNAVAAAYPEARVRLRSIFGAYAAGVGVNAIVPARGGDAVKLYMAHRAIKDATYTALAATLFVLAVFDSCMGTLILLFALTQGVLPSLGALPDLPSFDFGWFIDHPNASAVIGVILGLGILFLVLWIRRRVRDFKEHVKQGVAILRDRPRYLRQVALWQAGDWFLRFVAIWFFLDAFGIEQSVRNVLLVQVTTSLSTLVPVSPGGIGTEQAFLVYVFRDVANRSSLLAFSVGMKLTITLTNVVTGFAAIALTFRTLRFRRHLDAAKRPRAPEPEA
jgi:uncharacterized membrane protein YbhN (UPF0104 family)